MSVEIITFLMLTSLIGVILLGFPIGFSLAGIAMIFGIIFVGPQIGNVFMLRMFVTLSDYILIAIPLFIFMGIVIERAGIAGRLFDAMYVLFGGLRGGLAIATILACTIFAAATGVVGATVVTMGIMALPAMLKYKYDKPLACGSICAGGALGILIPPSILILVYAPVANVSVGALLIGAFIPGLLLSLLYVLYVMILCYLKPQKGPAISLERRVSVLQKLKMIVTSVLPVCLLILAVLGTIFFGLAAPTEAAAIGALAAVIMAAAYKALTWETLKQAAIGTMKTSAMVYLVVIGASFFTSIFMRLGCGDVVENLVMALPFGRWGIVITMWVIIIIMGAFLDWIGIVMIVVPLFSPIALKLGFDPIWFAMMNIVVLQTSFLSPPFAYAIFYLKGIAPPGIKLADIYWGVVPFLLLMCLAIAILAIFPGIILYAPKAAGLL
ncbi:MAG: TRAP transporter large permease subunit [Desulfobacterales bacterium]|nr:TRAP transporter large permease subunit [Desulfobacterales bacterium]